MMDILNNVDPSFIQGPQIKCRRHPNRRWVSASYGEGISNRKISTHVGDLNLMRVKEFPTWLEDEYSQLGEIYPRIAVSLGGARKRAIQAKEASLTCEPVGSHRLERI